MKMNKQTIFLFSLLAGLILQSCLNKNESLRPLGRPALPDDFRSVSKPADPQITEQSSFLTRLTGECTLGKIKDEPIVKLGVGAATATGLSNSGDLLAVSSTTGTYLYSIEDNRQVGYFDTSNKKTSMILFSPDDTLMVIGGPDGWLTIFNLVENSLHKQILAYNLVGSHDDKKGFKKLFFSKEGSYLAAIMDSNNAIILWNVPEFERVFIPDNVNAEGLVFINENTIAMVGLGIEIIQVSDYITQESILFTHNIKSNDHLQNWAVSNTTGKWEDTLVAVASKDGIVRITRLKENNKPWQSLHRPYSFQTSIKYPQLMFSPEGKYLLTYKNGSSTLVIWDTASGTRVRNLNAEIASQTRFANIDPVLQIQFSADSKYLLVMGATLYVWDLSSGDQVYSSLLIELTNTQFEKQDIYYDYYKDDYPFYYTYQISALRRTYEIVQPPRFEISKADNRLAYITPYYNVEAIQIGSNQLLVKDLLDQFHFFSKLEYVEDEHLVGLRGSDGPTRIWDARYQSVASMRSEPSGLQKVEHMIWPGQSATFDDKVASVDDLGTFVLQQGSERLYRENVALGSGGVAFSPDGLYIVTAHEKRIYFWNGITGRKLFLKSEEFPIEHIIFSPTGRYLISYGLTDLEDPDQAVRFLHVYKVPEGSSKEEWTRVAALDEGVFGAPIGFWPDDNTLVLERGHLKEATHGPTLVRLSDGEIMREWRTSEISISPNKTFLQLLYPGKGVVEFWGCKSE